MKGKQGNSLERRGKRSIVAKGGERGQESREKGKERNSAKRIILKEMRKKRRVIVKEDINSDGMIVCRRKKKQIVVRDLLICFLRFINLLQVI